MKTKTVLSGRIKNNLKFVITYPKNKDIKNVYKYINKLSKERTFVRYQGEKISLKHEKEWLQKKLKNIQNKKSITLFLVIKEKIYGICNIDLHDKTESHIASLGLSVDDSIRGQGLGEKLLRCSINEAKIKLKGLQIITLEVKSPNKIAVNLYKKIGFKKYGYLPKGTIHRGELVNVILMYKKII